MKDKTKNKVKLIRQHRNRTGGGSPTNLNLDNLQLRIITMCGENAIDGNDLDEGGLGEPVCQICFFVF